MHVDWSSVCLQSKETLSVLNTGVSGCQGCEMPGVALAKSSPWAALSSVFQIHGQNHGNVTQAKHLPSLYLCLSNQLCINNFPICAIKPF